MEQAAQQIDMLKADIAKAVADAAQLGKEISSLDQDVSVWEGDKKAGFVDEHVGRALRC